MAELGIESPIQVIVTGVPRAGRDDDEDLAAYITDIAAHPTPAYDRYAAKPKLVETVSVPPLPKPSPPVDRSERASGWRYVRAQVRSPDPDNDEPGEIKEGQYRIEGNLLRVEDKEGRSLGTATLRPGG